LVRFTPEDWIFSQATSAQNRSVSSIRSFIVEFAPFGSIPLRSIQISMLKILEGAKTGSETASRLRLVARQRNP
jgi:hypothetical protein